METWLNAKVKYEVNGYTGTVTAVAHYLTGETKLLVESIDTTGRPIEWWVDARKVIAID